MGIMDDLAKSNAEVSAKTASTSKAVTGASKVGSAAGSTASKTTASTSKAVTGAAKTGGAASSTASKTTTTSKSGAVSGASKVGSAGSQPAQSIASSSSSSGGGAPPSKFDPVDKDTRLSFGNMLDFVSYGNQATAEKPETFSPDELLALDRMVNNTHDGLMSTYNVADLYRGMYPVQQPQREDRLVAEVPIAAQPMPPNLSGLSSYTVDPRTRQPVPEALAGIEAAMGPLASLPRRDPRGYSGGAPSVFETDGQVRTPDGTIVRAGAPTPTNIGADTQTPPSMWDNVVNGAGKVLENTNLGRAVSGLFPDVWNGIGGAFKGLDDPGRTRTFKNGDEMFASTHFPTESIYTGTGYSGPNNWPVDRPADWPAGRPWPPHRPGDDDTPDTPVPPIVPAGANYYARTAQFPDLPPYRPGIDPEHTYFDYSNIPGWARGGIVHYADGGAVSPLAQQDPRVEIIAAAEDALENAIAGAPEADDEADVAKFVETFGADALEKLKANVTGGMKMRPGKGRMVAGPGGPTDDAVPALIDGQQPAALSDGEFVMSADAVQGAGGPEALQQLHDQLAARGKAA